MATNIDRLFREKLDQLEMAPSAKAWSQLEQQVSKKPSVWQPILRVAAVITLLVTATLVVYHRPQTGEQMPLANADHPKPDPASEWKLNLPEPTLSITEPVKTEATKEEQRTNKPLELDQKPPMISQLSIASITNKSLRVDLTTDSVKEPIPLKEEAPAIKITYIAGATEKPEELSDENRLNRVLERAREVNPGDLLADLRDAKNNLLKGN